MVFDPLKEMYNLWFTRHFLKNKKDPLHVNIYNLNLFHMTGGWEVRRGGGGVGYITD